MNCVKVVEDVLKSSRSLSHLLVSFLSKLATYSASAVKSNFGNLVGINLCIYIYTPLGTHLLLKLDFASDATYNEKSSSSST